MKMCYLENTPKLWIKNFPWKKTSDHKYSRGRVVVYGGQKEFTGATILSTLAALRTGTGSAKIICSKDTLQIYSIKFAFSNWSKVSTPKLFKAVYTKFLDNERGILDLGFERICLSLVPGLNDTPMLALLRIFLILLILKSETIRRANL